MENFSLRVNAFDLDFNLVNTRHKIIHLDEKVWDTWQPISVRLDKFQEEYKQFIWGKYRFRNDDIYQGHLEQWDEGVHGKHGLLHDLRQNDLWPSMQKLIEATCEADPVSIITARQAGKNGIQESLYIRLSDTLTPDQKKYMQEIAEYKYTRAKKWEDILKKHSEHIACYAMYNEQTSKELWFEIGGSWNTPERKSITILHDIHRFNKNEIGIREELRKNMTLPKEYWFSDDEHPNIIQIANRIITEKSIWGLRDRKFTLFHTDKNFPSKISIKND